MLPVAVVSCWMYFQWASFQPLLVYHFLWSRFGFIRPSCQTLNDEPRPFWTVWFCRINCDWKTTTSRSMLGSRLKLNCLVLLLIRFKKYKKWNKHQARWKSEMSLPVRVGGLRINDCGFYLGVNLRARFQRSGEPALFQRGFESCDSFLIGQLLPQPLLPFQGSKWLTPVLETT